MFEMVAYQQMTGRAIYTYLREMNFKTRTDKFVTLSSVYKILTSSFIMEHLKLLGGAV